MTILHYTLKVLLILMLLASGAVGAHAQLMYADDDERAIREDSIVIEGWEFEDFEVRIPRFVKLKSNHIDMNGANWTGLRKRLSEHEKVPFSIVHIGDSHLQADISTGYIRSQMQFDYGDAGRGLVVPLKLSRTNEPVDYYFRSTGSWSPLKFMSSHWPRTMGFTGASLAASAAGPVEITVGSRVTDTYSTFSEITLYYSGELKVDCVRLDDGTVINAPVTAYSDGAVTVFLPKTTGNVTLTVTPGKGCMLFGAFLSGDRPGLFYNVIGNNGATYSSYNRIPDMGHGVAALHPDLVIISLGTNEAFGYFDEARMIDNIDKLVNDIHRNNPHAKILLVTPMECQRKGSINHNVKSIRNTIAQYGKDHHIAVYDWYDIAGGDHASEKWIKEGLYGRDRIHHTVKGYRVQGYMLYDALTKALTN